MYPLASAPLHTIALLNSRSVDGRNICQMLKYCLVTSKLLCNSSFHCVVYCQHFQSPILQVWICGIDTNAVDKWNIEGLMCIYLNCFIIALIRHNVGPWSLYFSPTHTKFHKKIDSLYFTLFKYSLHIGEPTMTEPWLVKMGDVMSIYT